VTLEALIFDVDGTLADTEELHRCAFNAAFAAYGLEWEWTPELYHELLAVTGGKERLAHYLRTLDLPAEEAERLVGLVPELHAEKTRRFAARVASRDVQPRPGIERIVSEARAAGLRLGIASTTSPENVAALVPKLLGEGALSWFDVVATGDDVPRKKPAPDVYELAIARLGCAPGRCVAFEDSEPGVRAARAAGLYTVAVPTRWTAEHDLSAADLVLPSLGDPGVPLDPSSARQIGGIWLGVQQLSRLHWASRDAAAARGPVVS